MNIEDPQTAAVFYVLLAGVFFVVLWQVVRSAVLSALRAHRRERATSDAYGTSFGGSASQDR